MWRKVTCKDIFHLPDKLTLNKHYLNIMFTFPDCLNSSYRLSIVCGKYLSLENLYTCRPIQEYAFVSRLKVNSFIQRFDCSGNFM